MDRENERRRERGGVLTLFLSVYHSLSLLPFYDVSRGTEDVYYIPLIRTWNQQALYLSLIIYKRAHTLFKALRAEDQKL